MLVSIYLILKTFDIGCSPPPPFISYNICGKTVEYLTDEEMTKDLVQKAKKANVKIVVCGFSLKKFKVYKEDIPGELEIVDNGILHDFQLQKKGYLSIEL